MLGCGSNKGEGQSGLLGHAHFKQSKDKGKPHRKRKAGSEERESAGSSQPVLSRVETGKSGEPGDKSLVTLSRECTAYSGSMGTVRLGRGGCPAGNMWVSAL